jgi:membrane-bound metal-dependent hydrolase YbcI (DUF457 family)
MSLLVISILTLPVPLHLSIPLAGIITATEPLPDYDMQTSLIDHRGYSHTFIMAILVATLLTAVAAGVVTLLTQQAATLPAQSGVKRLATFFPQINILAILTFSGTITGFTAHFFADMITVGTGYHGIQPFAPFSQWEAPIQLCSADDSLWNGMLLAVGSIAVALSGYIQYHIFLGGI